jgi:hypothetical protein
MVEGEIMGELFAFLMGMFVAFSIGYVAGRASKVKEAAKAKEDKAG